MPTRPKSGADTERRKCRGLNTTALLLFLFFAGLFGDHLIGWAYFKYLCGDAGTHIHRVVDEVPGFHWRIANRHAPLQFGYRFIESGALGDSVTRYVIEGGRTLELKNVAPISRYSADFMPSEVLGLGVKRQQYVLMDFKTGEQLAVHRRFAFQGGWLVHALLAGFGGTAAACPNEPFDASRIITAVLRPAKDAP